MAILWTRWAIGAEATVGEQGERSYSRTLHVRSDNSSELRTSILNSGLVPIYGAPHPEDFAATCTKVNPKQHPQHPCLWVVSCEWSTKHPTEKNEKDNQKEPPDRRAQWKWKFVPMPNYLRQDLNGKAFVDSAGTPFDPAPNLPLYVDEVTITRYETTANRVRDRGFLNCTNSDQWNGSAAHEALVDDISCDEIWEMNQYWYRYTYRILESPKIGLAGGGSSGGWDPDYRLDTGPKILGADGKPIPIADAGMVDGRSCLLDGHGHRLAAGANPVFLEFRTHRPVAFAGLDLTPPA